MTTTHDTTHARDARAAPSSYRTDAAWLGGGLLLAFAIPFVLADTLGVQRDGYYALYGVAVAAFVLAYARATRLDLRRCLRRNWQWGVVLGVVGAAVMALIVVRSSDGSAHPDGASFWLAILWRGVYYGALDGVLLSVFPILAVFHAVERRRPLRRFRAKAVVGVVALAASVAFTVSYHLGYSDFRSSKLAKPVAGDIVWSAPTLLTLSPLGAPIAHAGLHVTAVVHDYETDVFLPPHTAGTG
jgi:hypothetical protein